MNKTSFPKLIHGDGHKLTGVIECENVGYRNPGRERPGVVEPVCPGRWFTVYTCDAGRSVRLVYEVDGHRQELAVDKCVKLDLLIHSAPKNHLECGGK